MYVCIYMYIYIYIYIYIDVVISPRDPALQTLSPYPLDVPNTLQEVLKLSSLKAPRRQMVVRICSGPRPSGGAR